MWVYTEFWETLKQNFLDSCSCLQSLFWFVWLCMLNVHFVFQRKIIIILSTYTHLFLFFWVAFAKAPGLLYRCTVCTVTTAQSLSGWLHIGASFYVIFYLLLIPLLFFYSYGLVWWSIFCRKKRVLSLCSWSWGAFLIAKVDEDIWTFPTNKRTFKLLLSQYECTLYTCTANQFGHFQGYSVFWSQPIAIAIFNQWKALK